MRCTIIQCKFSFQFQGPISEILFYHAVGESEPIRGRHLLLCAQLFILPRNAARFYVTKAIRGESPLFISHNREGGGRGRGGGMDAFICCKQILPITAKTCRVFPHFHCLTFCNFFYHFLAFNKCVLSPYG